MMITNSSNYRCNTSKCVTCNFKFVCASSPYCVIHNNTNNSISESSINTIVQNQSKIYSSQVEMIQGLNNNINEIYKSLSLCLDSINKISERLDNLENNQEISTEESTNVKDAQYTEIENSQIVPFSSELKEEKVMVEKKGLFGRKKWVEEKK